MEKETIKALAETTARATAAALTVKNSVLTKPFRIEVINRAYVYGDMHESKFPRSKIYNVWAVDKKQAVKMAVDLAVQEGLKRKDAYADLAD